jgi:uncharacterized protein (TIGR03437 family)
VSGNTFVTPSTPAHPGDALIIYATGLGLTKPTLPDGIAGVSNIAASIAVVVGGRSVVLLGAVSSPQFQGLFQIAFSIPSDAVPDSNGQISASLKVNETTLPFTIFLSK